MREIEYPFQTEPKLFGFMTALVVLVTLGPFATYDDLSLFGRIIYWSVMLTLVGFLIEFANHAALNARSLRRVPPVVRAGLATVLAAFPATSFVIFVDRSMRASQLGIEDYPNLFVQVALLSLAMTMADLFIWRRLFGGLPREAAGPSAAPAPQATPLAKPKLYTHLPPEMQQARIVSLSMQDHYVEVTTTAGSHLVLMRLGDAVALLEGIPGTQTHRSHWAAADFMRDLARAGQKTRLTLTDGRVLPVSTRYVEQVQALLP
ncbi:LytTR family DNA-binding domain-containing protein [Pseudaestuariivita sp.]|uniref:LytTR family DNA-binding domain-containing protein n=1 Tax=Pseudaestuariivita sp. TaxID=2211669 RepID=UPI004058968C